MFCVIYRSSKRDQTYLYVEKKDDFSRVPEELMKGFGQPQLAIIIFVGAGFHIHDKVRGTLCINITTGKVRCWIIR